MAAFARHFLSSAPSQAPEPPVKLPETTVDPTDDVIFGFTLDDTANNRGIPLSWTMKFDDVLDGDKLNESLTRLLSIGNWRKVGGRLRLNHRGKLEIHVPQAFSPTRPAVRYSTVTHDMSIDDHPLASQLPKPAEEPTVLRSPLWLVALAVPDDAPRTFEDWITGDVPQLGLHVVYFSDATLVSLSWLHTMMDGLGRRALVHNWSRVLAGREDEVQPFAGFRDDPTDAVRETPGGGDEKEEPYILQAQMLGLWGKLLFLVYLLIDLYWTEPLMHNRTIFLPRKTTELLKQQAARDLAAEAGSSGGAVPFVSEGDILTAWCCKLACLDKAPDSKRPVTVVNTVDVRSRLKSVFDPAAAYVQNLVIPCWVLLTVREIVARPLGSLALLMRAALAAQMTEGQARAILRQQLRTTEETGSPFLVGAPSGLLMPFTNWSKANFFDVVDFAPAVVRSPKAAADRVNAAGRPVYHHAAGLARNDTVRNFFTILGKDPQENYWINAMLNPTAWDRVSEALQQLSGYEEERGCHTPKA